MQCRAVRLSKVDESAQPGTEIIAPHSVGGLTPLLRWDIEPLARASRP